MKKKTEDREFIREVALSSPIMEAFTISRKESVIEKRTLFVPEDGIAEEFAKIVIEQYAQATILEMSKFKQHHADRPACICSTSTQEMVEPKETKAIVIPLPFRCNAYPRDFYETEWIEPFVSNLRPSETTGVIPTPNPDWQNAMWEMMIYIDPSQAFYDRLPVNLYRHESGFVFEISRDFLLLEDAVDCVPVKLHE